MLLSDAVVDNGLQLMTIPDDLDAAFRKFIPPFGAAGNPIDITGGEPPTTYQNTIKLGLDDERIHALILGYWHTIITPPMVFAGSGHRGRRRGTGARASRSRSSPRWSATPRSRRHRRSCSDHGIPAYPYTTELPVDVLGAKYRWSRLSGHLKGRA